MIGTSSFRKINTPKGNTRRVKIPSSRHNGSKRTKQKYFWEGESQAPSFWDAQNHKLKSTMFTNRDEKDVEWGLQTIYKMIRYVPNWNYAHSDEKWPKPHITTQNWRFTIH